MKKGIFLVLCTLTCIFTKVVAKDIFTYLGTSTIFEGNVVFDCDCLASAFTFCTFCGDMIFTDNCKWCGAFKSIVSQGKIIIPGGMLSIDPSNFIMLFKGSTTYTGTKDEFLALVARSDISENWVEQVKKIVKFSFNWND